MKTTLPPWTRASNYIGTDWTGWLVFLSRHRDSGDLENSNFEAGLAIVKKVASIQPVDDDDSASVQVVSENHWAVGWVEWIAIHPSDLGAVKAAEEVLARLEGYPVLDDEDHSRREWDSAQEIWRNCYNERERAQIIRKNRTSFNFDSWAELRDCIRGEIYCGEAWLVNHN